MKHLENLASLKATQLKSLLTAVGLQTTGRKQILQDNLLASLTAETKANSTNEAQTVPRILSIDMGLRNMSYCLLSPPSPPTAKTAAPRSKSKTKPKKTNPNNHNKITIHAWNRFAVIPRPSTSTEEAATEAEENPSPTPIATATDTFSPSILSQAAFKIITQHFLPLNPTHILIERQRFRSGSASSILEWTIRVNMLESMLHGILTTLRSLDPPVWNGVVVPVNPRTVSSFYEAGLVGGTVKRAAVKRALEIKKMKIKTVAGWLQDNTDGRGDGGLELMGDQVERMKVRFLEKFQGKTKGRGDRKKIIESEDDAEMEEERGEEKLNKLDDLADSLLQGVVWLTWQDNRRLLLNQGLEDFLEEEGRVNRLLPEPRSR